MSKMCCKYLLFLLAPLVLLSCRKETDMPQASDPPPTPVTTALLKDIVIPHLPSPYYHFEYDITGKPSFASFASGYFMYDILYSENRISELRNNIIVNKDRLKYTYDNAGNVILISYIRSNGEDYRRIFFTYAGRKLTESKREVKSGSNFIVDKILIFRYHPDGNLSELTTHRPAIPMPAQPETTYTDHFDQYDSGINTDGFSLMHDEFFDHVLLLPSVQLQKNNPVKITHTGDGVNYKIDYTYTYNEKNVPLAKDGVGIWLNGSDSGKQFASNSAYSYY